MAACAALPDADMLTAINKQHAEQVAGRSQLVIPLLSGDGAVRDGSARLAAVPHSPERFCGTAGFTVFLKRTILTEEKEAPVFGSRDPLFFDPSFPKT